MKNLNITLPIIQDKEETQVTFYYIGAIGKGKTPEKSSLIYSEGQTFSCTIPFGELWDKLNRLNNESKSR